MKNPVKILISEGAPPKKAADAPITRESISEKKGDIKNESTA